MPAKKVAPAKVQSTAASVPVSWDSIEEASAVVYSTRTVTVVDREESTPTVIKNRVTAAYDATVAADAAKYFNQRLATPEQAEEFIKLARLYATSKGMTFRGKVVDPSSLAKMVNDGAVPADTRTGTVVTYSVKPRETRKKLSDEARRTIVSTLRKSPNRETVDTLATTFDVSKQTVMKIADDNGITLPAGKRGRKSAAK